MFLALLVGCSPKKGSEMEYTIEAAQEYIGKRVIVSLCHVSTTVENYYSGFWGDINFANEEGLLLTVEGGIEDEFWMIPPDLSSFKKAEHECYQLNDDTVVEDVDFEVYFSVSDDLEALEDRDV